MRLVEENKLEDFGLCDYRNHLQMHNLDDNDLQKIFVEYIKKNKNRYMQIHGVDVDVKLCEIEAKKIINKMEKECKTPLYVMYIADAWISDDNKKGRNWNKEETLEYVIRKEDERLKSFFEGNREKEAALKRITTFSVVLNGINLGKRCPKFLYREFELIREEFGYDNPNLRHLFNEIGEIEYTKDIAFKSALPEIRRNPCHNEPSRQRFPSLRLSGGRSAMKPPFPPHRRTSINFLFGKNALPCSQCWLWAGISTVRAVPHWQERWQGHFESRPPVSLNFAGLQL